MKIALVHDDLIQFGGAERLLLTLYEIWPEAPIYTSMYDPQLVKREKRFEGIEIKASWMQKLPFKKQLRRFYLPLYPLAFESFNFDDFDLVISSSTRFAHSIVTKPRTYHICYLNSPPRYLWEEQSYLQKENFTFPLNWLVKLINSYLRIWDVTAATRVDAFIANSENVAAKISKIYRRQSKIVYPFVDFKKFTVNSSQLTDRRKKAVNREAKTENYFLIVTRLLAWKRVDIAINVANQLKLPLKVVGAGPDFFRLKKIAGPTVEFIGSVEDAALVKYYQNCQALIITQDEDFGIASLEAQAMGKPVIAYAAGGALETVIEGKTGLFFFPQTTDALIETILKFQRLKFDSATCINNASQFSKQTFVKNFAATVENLWRSQQII